MVLIYIHRGISLEVAALDIVLEDRNLMIKWARTGIYTTDPKRQFLVVKMDKVECDIISFANVYSNGYIHEDYTDSITLNQ